MSNLIAVLDACVLFPASLRDTLLRAAQKGLYRPHWSADIIDEVICNLKEDRGLSDEQAARLTSALIKHFGEAVVIGYDDLIPGLTCHEKDRHVLAAAVHTHAQVIITVNLKHLPESALYPYGIEAQHPDIFLDHLYNLVPDVMVEIIRAQAADLRRPPATVERLLDTLQAHAPVFVSKVRRNIVDTDE